MTGGVFDTDHDPHRAAAVDEGFDVDAEAPVPSISPFPMERCSSGGAEQFASPFLFDVKSAA